MTAFAFQTWRQTRRARYRRWWSARLKPTDALSLNLRNVYILPTRFGWMFGLMLFVLLLTAISYQSNLSYLLTFLLAATGASAMFMTTAVLRGLSMHARLPSSCYVGESTSIELVLHSNDAQDRYALCLRFYEAQDASPLAWADVPAQSQSHVNLCFVPTHRGRHAIPWVVVETRFPLGLFRAWAVWLIASELLVFAQPEQHAPSWQSHAANRGDETPGLAHQAEELDGFRAYRRGDPLKWLVWKKFAKSQELVSRDWARWSSETVWFDYTQTQLSEREARLSRLTAWLLRAEERGQPYGLRLPGHADVAPATGTAHLHRCLTQLALFE